MGDALSVLNFIIFPLMVQGYCSMKCLCRNTFTGLPRSSRLWPCHCICLWRLCSQVLFWSISCVRRDNASFLFRCCERSSLATAVRPLGRCRARTADSVLLRCWPPGPLARMVSTRISFGSGLPPLAGGARISTPANQLLRWYSGLKGLFPIHWTVPAQDVRNRPASPRRFQCRQGRLSFPAGKGRRLRWNVCPW